MYWGPAVRNDREDRGNVGIIEARSAPRSYPTSISGHELFGRNENDPGRTLMEIKGKTVLVTGTSSGVGAAIAKEMALAGAGELLLLARNENELKKVAAAIASLGGKARIYPVDLSNPDQVTAIAQRIEREATVPDIIVNNAGYSGQWKFLDETTPKEI